MLEEKYRPSKLSEVVGQDDVTKRIESAIKSGEIQHMLFAGPQGTGKTSAAICVAKELYGANWKMNFKETNASDERGIDTIRGDVKNFASTSAIGGARFKVMLLDEADSLTSDAQSALRRTMEKYSSSCKFILTCNYVSKIIPPIQSRCEVYKFIRISNEKIKEKMLYICEKEKVQITNEAIEAICYVAEGDMRKTVGTLEGAISFGKGKVGIEHVYKLHALADREKIVNVLKHSLSGEFVRAVEMLEHVMFNEGLDGMDILKQLVREVLMVNMNNKMRMDIIEKIGDCEFRIVEGSNEPIQMKWLMASLGQIGCKKYE